MKRTGLAMLAVLLVASAARAAAPGTCDDEVAKFDAYLKTHPNATGTLRQTKSAQLTYQPSKADVEKAIKEGRQHLFDLLNKAKEQQAAHDENGCRATLKEVMWMVQP
jgi:hypothetical protein